MVRKREEIRVRVPNQATPLATALAAIGGAGAEVLASSSYWEGSDSVILAVPEHVDRLKSALHAAGLKFTAQSVVLLGPYQRAVAFDRAQEKLTRAGLTVFSGYTSWAEPDCSYIVLHTDDDDRAVKLLTADALVQDRQRDRLAA